MVITKKFLVTKNGGQRNINKKIYNAVRENNYIQVQELVSKNPSVVKLRDRIGKWIKINSCSKQSKMVIKK